MSTPSEQIAAAFSALSHRAGFTERADQRQLALLLSDMIEQGTSGAFEAPTGLGKSLAALIPALVHAKEGKRTVVATYTNVLAEQYWRKDLPLALSLLPEEDRPKVAFLIGRQRYACLIAMDEVIPEEVDAFRHLAELGVETEFRNLVRRPLTQLSSLWPKVVVPPVCPGRLCPAYDDCFYYRARRQAEEAPVIITNHSVVIQDALMARSSEDGTGLLGKYDFLIIDEAHDFASAATNGLEFEVSGPKLSALIAIGNRIEKTLQPLAEAASAASEWGHLCADFRGNIEAAQRSLIGYSLEIGRPGILTATPPEVLEHPQVKAYRADESMEGAKRVAKLVSEACLNFVAEVDRRASQWRAQEAGGKVGDAIRNYKTYLVEYGAGCFSVFEPNGVAVSYVGRTGSDAILRQDVVGLGEPLRELIWDRVPTASISATLALDGNFDYFKRSTGASPDFAEILPTPFDYPNQAAVYLPKVGVIPDPTVARRDGNEARYYHCLARELSQIIRLMEGRTLALFHSRKEMDAVFAQLSLPPDLPVYTQQRSGAGSVGERFIDNERASLFALRSFWTGFDAPGPTLSCVALVRVPFEVPVDPPAVARIAYLQTLGIDAFREHTLPQAKMLMRQGAGRLIRHAEDVGVIAILDPRVRTKPYGEEFLANLPPGMREFDDFIDAAGWVLGR